MNGPTGVPNVTVEVINITQNSKGFKFYFKPIENIENIESYRIYVTDTYYNTKPNSNNNNYLVQEIPYSTDERYFFYIPENTGLNYVTIFSKNILGMESTGTLFSGYMPNQKFIKEVSFKNLNYFTDVYTFQDGNISGGMISTLNQDKITTFSDYCYLGWQISFSSPTTPEVQAYNPNFTQYDFSRYFRNKTVNMYNRVLPFNTTGNSSGILIDNSLLKSNLNDIYALESLGVTPEKSAFAGEINVPVLPLNTGDVIQGNLFSDFNRYFIFDYIHNYQGFLSKNESFVRGTTEQNAMVYNPSVNDTGIFGTTGDRENLYVKIAQPGHYNNYYVTIEAVDDEGFSSAGGNIATDTTTSGSTSTYFNDRYSNSKGYKILQVNHNDISRSDVLKIFKNYKREDNNKIIFDIKDIYPNDVGIDSIIILPIKYNENINDQDRQEFFDEFIFIRNLKEDPSLFLNNKNYKIEILDGQYESNYRLTTYLSPESPLVNDNIFSVKLYYLNSLQASALNNYLALTNNSLQAMLNYIQNTDLIDKYIYLNKFIKDNSNYTSTIAASYQGLVYFFTPESYPYISWPNEDYRNENFNGYGARMLDFEKDGVASGPEFLNYFPLAQARIDNSFPNEIKYKTTYRCLDSYKYNSSNVAGGLDPEDVPSSGINGTNSYLGVYDPGNIGDQESPEVVDFKAIRDDLKYFSAKNIYSVEVLSVGIQKDDAYSIIEFILDIPDAEDFIIQGISGTDSILEKGIKKINGVNYHYFVAKFVSSCGINDDPILFGTKIDAKNIIDSKKMISFLIYPTRFKIVQDAQDVPFFGDFYLLATDPIQNRFSLVKSCPYVIIDNSTDCLKGCCADLANIVEDRAQNKQFYILSKYDAKQTSSNYPYGKIYECQNKVLGSLIWNYKAVDYNSTPYEFSYTRPVNQNETLNLVLAFCPEHNVTLRKVIIYAKEINDTNNISWTSSDVISSQEFSSIRKLSPTILSIPDFIYSQGGENQYQDFLQDYKKWINEIKTFGFKVLIIDQSGDSIEQVLIFREYTYADFSPYIQTNIYGDSNIILSPSSSQNLNNFTYTSTNSSVIVMNNNTGIITGFGTTNINWSGISIATTAGYTGLAKTITIEKKTLTVIPDNKTIITGQNIPSLSVNISGFVYNQNSGDLISLPTGYTIADTNSPSGIYPILASGGSGINYKFNYKTGFLTINETTGFDPAFYLTFTGVITYGD